MYARNGANEQKWRGANPHTKLHGACLCMHQAQLSFFLLGAFPRQRRPTPRRSQRDAFLNRRSYLQANG